MALAATVGAAATMLNLRPGAGTTRLESTTNFFAVGRAGLVRAEATPLHRGKRTPVWPTWITDEAGRRLSHTAMHEWVAELWATERMERMRTFATRQALRRTLRPPRRPLPIALGMPLIRVGRCLDRVKFHVAAQDPPDAAGVEKRPAKGRVRRNPDAMR